MTDRLENDIKLLRDEFSDLRSDLRGIAGTLQDLMKHGKDEVLSHAQKSSNGLGYDLNKLAQSTNAHIEEKPLASVLSSFGVGLVLGLLFSGRR